MTPYMFLYIKRQINNQRTVCYYQKSANQTANGCFCCKIRNAIWGYLGFRATTQRHHMGISGIRSKQLCTPYGVSRAQWVNSESPLSSNSILLSHFELSLQLSPSRITISTTTTTITPINVTVIITIIIRV